MKVKHEKIVEMTNSEAFERYLKTEYDDICDFPEYIRRLKNVGCKIIEDGGEQE